ncbi:MAG: RluA family pseudouridine synthase [Acidiferrobacter sp.]
MDGERHFWLEFSSAETGLRLDRALALRLPQFSRTALQGWLREGRITLDAKPMDPSLHVKGCERVLLDLPEPVACEVVAQDIPLVVVFEDDTLLVINKPAGLVVHPGAGCAEGTLQNALLYYAPELGVLPRSGIVHRLDKDTSGLLVIARTEGARRAFIEQLKTREMGREYEALVVGTPPLKGFVDAPIGRDVRHRTRMAVNAHGRPARTDYEITERLGAFSLLKVRLQSGRTHQIRVHMTHLGFPLVGDGVYGGGRALHILPRQALHARRLTLRHPKSGEQQTFEAPRPPDLAAAILRLREGLP